MSPMQMFDALIGLMFVYLVLSLVVTALVEAWNEWWGLRGRNLRAALGRLLRSEPLLEAFYAHSRILALQNKDSRCPSYIRDPLFAEVLLDVLAGGRYTDLRDSPHQLKATIDEQGRQLDAAITAGIVMDFIDQAEGDAAELERLVAQWFRDTQERAIGWFRRKLSWRLMLIGLVVTLATNADTLHIFTVLTADDSLRQTYVESVKGALEDEELRACLADGEAAASTECQWLDMAKREAVQLTPLLGWEGRELQLDWALARNIVGWLLTAVALSLGAPFWFDLLQKFMRLRGSLRPAEAPGEAKGSARGQAVDGVVKAPPARPTFDPDDFGAFHPDAVSYQLINAFWMVRLSLLAYASPTEVTQRCRAWGLDVTTMSVRAGDVDTQAFLAWSDQVAVLAFRGLERNRGDILTSARVGLVDCPWAPGIRLHQGFTEALDAVWDEAQSAIALHHAGRPLWVTGHGLGGALAALAGLRLSIAANSPGDVLEGLSVGGVYTCGQPRCGDAAFAGRLDTDLGPRMLRIVNNRDAVPLVPPPTPGGYAHGGSVLYIDELGRLLLDPPVWYKALDKLELDRDQLRDRLKEMLGDHGAATYLTALSDALRKQTES